LVNNIRNKRLRAWLTFYQHSFSIQTRRFRRKTLDIQRSEVRQILLRVANAQTRVCVNGRATTRAIGTVALQKHLQQRIARRVRCDTRHRFCLSTTTTTTMSSSVDSFQATPIFGSRQKQQLRRVALADSTNKRSTTTAAAPSKGPTATDHATESNVSITQQQCAESTTPLPRRPVATAASESHVFQNRNGSFEPMSTPIARASAVVSVLTVDRVRAPFMQSHSIPLLPSPARASGATRQYSQEALLVLKNSPLIRVGEDSQVPVGPWSPGRVNRPTRAPAHAAQQQAAKNLSALFEASTETEPELEPEPKEPEQQQQDEQPDEQPDEQQDEQAALQRRQKQIDITKQSDVYLAYVGRRSRDQRLPSDPRTPRVTQRCSKRAWLGQLAKWRRDLHALANGQLPSPLKPLSADAANSRTFTPSSSRL
jgi:hypothetical protein